MANPDRGRGRGGFSGRSRGRGGRGSKSHHHNFRMGNFLLSVCNFHESSQSAETAHICSPQQNQAYGPGSSSHHAIPQDGQDDGSMEYLNQRYGALYSPMFTQDPWTGFLATKP